MSSKWMLALVVVALGCSVVPSANGEIDDYHEKWRRTIEDMTSPPAGDVSIQALSCKGVQFNTPDGECKLDPRPEAKSAHLLTPEDIGIVAAIGDSITAGFGAKASNIFDSPTKESRGVSWCIGGDGVDYRDCATIPNILKTFNPDLYGASTGAGDANSAGAKLNRAISGAESKDIYSQAERLVSEIRALPLEQQDQWKLVTLWIGGNDLCGNCGNGAITPDKYFGNILQTLEFLKLNLPKTLVNVPQALDVTQITDTTGLICGVVHWFACDCARHSETSDRAKEYMARLDELDDYPGLNDGDDFAVVVQPFFKEIYLPEKENGDVDMSFFAPDCFHMSVKGHRAIAAGLWNNMVSPEGSKDNRWEPYNPTLKCPDPDHPYFYTSRTQSLLDAQSQSNSGGFNAQSLPKQEKSGDESESSEDEWSIGQIFGVAIGTAAAAYTVVVAVGIGVAVWIRRHRRADPNSEVVPLVKRQ